MWALTQRNEVIAKADMSSVDYQPPPIDDMLLKRKNIKKLFVSRNGNHCILLADHELFYNNWKDNTIIQFDKILLDSIKVERSASVTSYTATSGPRAFKSIDISHDLDDESFFEILLGTVDGQIFHAALEYVNGTFDVVEPLECVLELTDYKPILDLKIAKVNFDQNMVLAVTESSLYQFTGDTVVKSVLLNYKNSKEMLKRSQLTLEANVQELDRQRAVSVQEDDTIAQSAVSLQLFFD